MVTWPWVALKQRRRRPAEQSATGIPNRLSPVKPAGSAAPLDPGTDRRGGVIGEQLHVGEHLGDAAAAAVLRCLRSDLAERNRLAGWAFAQQRRQTIEDAEPGGG